MGSYQWKEEQLDLDLELIHSQIVQERQVKQPKMNNCVCAVIWDLLWLC